MTPPPRNCNWEEIAKRWIAMADRPNMFQARNYTVLFDFVGHKADFEGTYPVPREYRVGGTRFTCFPDLPLELRRKIWTFAFEDPRVIEAVFVETVNPDNLGSAAPVVPERGMFDVGFVDIMTGEPRHEQLVCALLNALVAEDVKIKEVLPQTPRLLMATANRNQAIRQRNGPRRRGNGSENSSGRLRSAIIRQLRSPLSPDDTLQEFIGFFLREHGLGYLQQQFDRCRNCTNGLRARAIFQPFDINDYTRSPQVPCYFQAACPVPTVLQICRESRSHALETYKLALGTSTPSHLHEYRHGNIWNPINVRVPQANRKDLAEPRTYVDFERDTVYVSGGEYGGTFAPPLDAMREEDTNRIRHFAMDEEPFHHDTHGKHCTRFAKVETFELIFHHLNTFGHSSRGRLIEAMQYCGKRSFAPLRTHLIAASFYQFEDRQVDTAIQAFRNDPNEDSTGWTKPIIEVKELMRGDEYCCSHWQ